MYPFTFIKPIATDAAIKIAQENNRAKFICGGTNLVDLMKMNIEKPDHLVDINSLPFKKIETLSSGNILIGALVTNSDVAYHETILNKTPLLSQALLAGASPQLRNVATTGGNILQRTRCYYFYDTAMPCNKREPGSGCSAIKGYNRIHAVIGTSDQCIATHPSDMCVAMVALDAIIHTRSAEGERQIRFSEFHTLPGEHPETENVLKHGELITGIEIPASSFSSKSAYIKVRDRSSYDFALASAAVAMHLSETTIQNVRIGLGGIATKPWRAVEAEQLLSGKSLSNDNFKAAAEAALKDAKGYQYNSFKIELAKRTLISALQTAGGI